MFLANKKGEIEEYKTIMISDYSTQADRNNIRMRFINEGKNIDLDMQFEKQQIVKLYIYADKNRIIYVFSNILINSINY